jgi:hypothetical protein
MTWYRSQKRRHLVASLRRTPGNRDGMSIHLVPRRLGEGCNYLSASVVVRSPPARRSTEEGIDVVEAPAEILATG